MQMLQENERKKDGNREWTGICAAVNRSKCVEKKAAAQKNFLRINLFTLPMQLSIHIHMDERKRCERENIRHLLY